MIPQLCRMRVKRERKRRAREIENVLLLMARRCIRTRNKLSGGCLLHPLDGPWNFLWENARDADLVAFLSFDRESFLYLLKPFSVTYQFRSNKTTGE